MVEKLLTKLRGKDYRAAYRAIPQLCKLDDGSLAGDRRFLQAERRPRRFQFEVARIALAEGIVGLTKQWLRLGTDEQRRVLLQEIGPEWDDEWKVEIAIAALEEPDDKVRGYAVLLAKYAAQRGHQPRPAGAHHAGAGPRHGAPQRASDGAFLARGTSSCWA